MPAKKYTDTTLLVALNHSATVKEMITKLGLKICPSNIRNVNRRLKQLGANTDHMYRGGRRLGYTTWTKHDLELAVSESRCISQVVERLKMVRGSANFKTMRKYIQVYKLDTSHFYSDDEKKKARITALQKYRQGTATKPIILIVNSKTSQRTLRHFVKTNNLLQYRCACGVVDVYNDKPIKLQLDHINGINSDNRLENLRWLCPNCHSQTETFCGKNKRFSYQLSCNGSTSASKTESEGSTPSAGAN